MRAIAIKMKSYVETVSVASEHMQGLILRTLLLSLGALGLGYIFLLGALVFNITERKTLEAEARTLESEVGDLELTYLALASKVDLAFSLSLGFKETKAKFVTRKAPSALGSLHNIKLGQNEI